MKWHRAAFKMTYKKSKVKRSNDLAGEFLFRGKTRRDSVSRWFLFQKIILDKGVIKRRRATRPRTPGRISWWHFNGVGVLNDTQLESFYLCCCKKGGTGAAGGDLLLIFTRMDYTWRIHLACVPVPYLGLTYVSILRSGIDNSREDSEPVWYFLRNFVEKCAKRSDLGKKNIPPDGLLTCEMRYRSLALAAR